MNFLESYQPNIKSGFARMPIGALGDLANIRDGESSRATTVPLLNFEIIGSVFDVRLY
jgi:hypothetical protein